MILLLDNFDSFTYNLADYFNQSGIACHVQRNNVPLQKLRLESYKGVVLSPGPGMPEDSGNIMEVIQYYHHKLPVLGICLGHQAIGKFFGAGISKADFPMHGKISEIICEKDPVFKNIPSPFKAVRYHSLLLDSLPPSLLSIAYTNRGEIMAIKHRAFPVYGLQFHPEAILTEYGKQLLKNWAEIHGI